MKMMMLLVVFMATCELTNGLDNGLALTPPMAWTSWNLW
jgi:hypothetical protein